MAKEKYVCGEKKIKIECEDKKVFLTNLKTAILISLGHGNYLPKREVNECIEMLKRVQ